jgi:hypothetical protein
VDIAIAPIFSEDMLLSSIVGCKSSSCWTKSGDWAAAASQFVSSKNAMREKTIKRPTNNLRGIKDLLVLTQENELG